MAKDPSFPLYAQDFFFDTLSWPEEHVGAWIRMLSYLWINGPCKRNALACTSINALAVIDGYPEKFIDCENGKISSKRLEIERTKRIENRARHSERGKKGANARWKKKEEQALHKHCISNSLLEKDNDNDNEKEIRKGQRKRKKGVTKKTVEVINYLNMATGRRFRAETGDRESLISARIKEFSFQDVKDVIDLKTHQWIGDEKMNGFLRPETLFNATKFENYYNEVQSIKDGTTKIKNPNYDEADQLVDELRNMSERHRATGGD